MFVIIMYGHYHIPFKTVATRIIVTIVVGLTLWLLLVTEGTTTLLVIISYCFSSHHSIMQLRGNVGSGAEFDSSNVVIECGCCFGKGCGSSCGGDS